MKESSKTIEKPLHSKETAHVSSLKKRPVLIFVSIDNLLPLCSSFLLKLIGSKAGRICLSHWHIQHFTDFILYIW